MYWGTMYWDTMYWDTMYWDTMYWDTMYWDTMYWGTMYWGTMYWGTMYWGTMYWGTMYRAPTVYFMQIRGLYFKSTFACSPTLVAGLPVVIAFAKLMALATMLEGESQYSAFSTFTLSNAISGSLSSLGNQALS